MSHGRDVEAKQEIKAYETMLICQTPMSRDMVANQEITAKSKDQDVQP